ncbi:coiled-coil domain-containing protein 22 homolog [Teleopsis dalmanni]|uniref:coiled-coil domain-containing protein 22 homolog n=1 Tax=Teleopsis dalmanni TaxID=139649 RepID=UPI0018CCE1DC|nr:coiled-coil domain-containing protein 22 homolog [Teleopsis dalmanni]
MDEVDKIIIYSLRQIGCDIEGDAFNLTNFTPELLVKAVSTCLQEIKPTPVPRTLPPNMAQRFAVATALAEACASYGYRGDIGYQTFLYPNAIEVRRLLMFLIEQLPKDNQTSTDALNQGPIGEYEILRREIKEKILNQLKRAWIPQYSRAVKQNGCSSFNIKFVPQPNLNILGTGTIAKEVQNYLQQQAPNIFQQTAMEEYDLISSVIHKNSIDLHSKDEEEPVKFTFGADNAETTKIPEKVVNEDASTKDVTTKNKVLSPVEKLTEEINLLKSQYEALLAERKGSSMKIVSLRSQQTAVQNEIESLQQEAKMHERTCVVLENPKENIAKLENLIATTKERRKTREQQWQSYRKPMEETLKVLQTAKQAKNVQNVLELRETITQLEQTLHEKNTQHAQLSEELKNNPNAAALRKEYTRRILEFIGNIRKQRNDIFKVLDDTRDLQKQLNAVSAQLQRQFNYTDDLLFQSAKHDLHAKKAYKLLATLHETCSHLVELVSQTGNVTKEIRDLEVQIDREKMKNIALSLEQISADIRNFEIVIKNIQTEIHKVENKITAG